MNRGLSPDLYGRILSILQPRFETQNDRIALLRPYLGTFTSYWSRVTWEGSSQEFCSRLVDLSLEHGDLTPGKPALVEVLKVIQNQMGGPESVQVDALIQEVVSILRSIGIGFARAKPIVPPLLPYLLDWEEQEFRLEEALDQIKNQPDRLLLCCVHGDEFQCLDKFLDRLEVDTLPEALKLDPSRASIKTYLCDWPSPLKDINELPRRLQRSLAENILGQSNAGLVDIQKHLAAFPTPVIIHSHLLTEDLERHETKAILAYLDFWEKWPGLQPGQQLIVFLFFKYQTFEHLGFFQRRKFNSINQKVASFFEKELVQSHNHLYTLALPRLENITRSQAENWARKQVPAQVCPIEVLISEITRLYSDWQKKYNTQAIPMESISSFLKEVLGKNLGTWEARI